MKLLRIIFVLAFVIDLVLVTIYFDRIYILDKLRAQEPTRQTILAPLFEPRIIPMQLPPIEGHF